MFGELNGFKITSNVVYLLCPIFAVVVAKTQGGCVYILLVIQSTSTFIY